MTHCDCCAYNGECVFWHMYEEMVQEIMRRYGASELYKDYVKAYRPEYRPNCCTCREGVEKYDSDHSAAHD